MNKVTDSANKMIGVYFNQPVTKTLHDFNIVPIVALFYCAYVCERIIDLLAAASASAAAPPGTQGTSEVPQ